MLSVAMSVTALGSAAPTVKDVAKVPALKPVSAKKHHWYEIGKATWYGGKFDGRKTADGETYNENELTCAHRTLPLGTLIRVTNLQNNRSTVVRVTDRGPWVKHAILDLSHAAARKLGFTGTAQVRIDKVNPEDLPRQELAQLEPSHENDPNAAE